MNGRKARATARVAKLVNLSRRVVRRIYRNQDDPRHVGIANMASNLRDSNVQTTFKPPKETS